MVEFVVAVAIAIGISSLRSLFETALYAVSVAHV